MKTCPVCRSRCFDDMPICYGCLHDFEREFLIRNAIDNLAEDAEDMPEEAVLPKPLPRSYGAPSALQVLEESDASGKMADASDDMSIPDMATIKASPLSNTGVHSFGVSGSDAAEDKFCSPASNEASSWITLEINERYRFVFRFESG